DRGKKPRSRRRCRLRARDRHRGARSTPRSDLTHCASAAGGRGGELIYSRIAGTGSYLPKKIITNADLEKMVDTTDEWIRTRTGIERRHVPAHPQTTLDLAEHAARRAPEAAGGAPAARALTA